jgi:dienelactone hydrolase
MSPSIDRRRLLTSATITVVAGACCPLPIVTRQSRGESPVPPSSPASRSPADARDPERLRAALLACLGGPWPEPCDLKPRIERVEQRAGHRLELVRYEVEPGEVVGAYVLVPDGVTAASPAVAVWHQHNGEYHLGKSEPAGLAGNPMHHTGVALARLGYVAICPDAVCFEDRQDATGRLARGDYERFEFLRHVVAGRCLAWKNILDMRRAIDYLVSRPEVDVNRIGCFGHSMGSMHTWLVGPFEERIRCLVGNCCLPTYAAIHRLHMLHCFPNFVPGWERHGDVPDIVGLTAPRPLHLNFGERDAGSPLPEVRGAMETIGRAYAAANAADRFRFFIEPDEDHVLSEAMWQRATDWFARHLRG